MTDILAECLIVVARHYSLPATTHSLKAGLPLDGERLTPDLLERAATRAGFNSRLDKFSLADIPQSLCPAILLLKSGDACVYLGRQQDGSARVIYPQFLRETTVEDFKTLEQNYVGYAQLLQPKLIQGVKENVSAASRDVHWFWSAVRGNSSVYRDAVVAAFFINLFALAVPLFTMNVYDRVVPNLAIDTLWVLAVGVIGIVIADYVLKALRAHFLDLASRRIDVDLSAKIMEQALGLRLEYRPASVGSFAVSLRSFETLRDFLASATMTTLIDLPFALLFMAVIAWVAWPLVLPVAFAILVILLFASVRRYRLRTLTESAYEAGALRNATLIESLSGIDTLKAMAAESVMQTKWEQSTRYLSSITFQLRLATLSVTHFFMACQQLTTVAVIVVGVFLIAQGELTMGGLIASTMLAGRCIAPIGQAAGLITQAHNARVAMNNLDELFDMPTDRREQGAFLQRDSFKGELAFNKVTFAYPNSVAVSLAEASFRIEPGEKVGILGRIGSGKSTVAKLALGLYEPVEGAVLADGIDLRQLDPSEFRASVGYVPQDITLFRGTLRENLTLSRHGVEDADLVRAAQQAGLLDFVNRHPLGFDMPIGERGDSVSGGQRKAIAIARALINEPQILLLDEPTGSMDNATEALVKKGLKAYKPGHTLVLVTHRTAMLELVDRLIVIDGGKIVADGARDTVLESLRSGKVSKTS